MQDVIEPLGIDTSRDRNTRDREAGYQMYVREFFESLEFAPTCRRRSAEVLSLYRNGIQRIFRARCRTDHSTARSVV